MKVTISRLFELSKYLATDAGRELEGALSYISDLAELTVRGLRNQLTFDDNLFCDTRIISVRHGVETTLTVPDRRRPKRIYIDRVLSEYYVVTGFGWRFSPSGEVILKVNLDGTPPGSLSIPVAICIFY